MRLKYNQTMKGRCYYIIRSVYRNGKNTSETYEKLGYLEDIRKIHGCPDPEKWMHDHLQELNEQEQAQQNRTDQDIIRWVRNQSSMQGAIKQLIREKIAQM